MKKLAASILTGLVVIGFGVWAPLASAAQAGNISGKPAYPRSDNPRTEAIFIHSLKPGQTVSDGVKVYNTTDQTKEVNVYAVDSILSSGGAFACAQKADKKLDVGNWIHLASTDLSMPAHSTKIVPFTITAPKNADVGEHDGCIAIQGVTTNQTTTSGVVLSFRSAIRVALTIPGKITKALSISTVNVQHEKNNKYLVIPVVRNNGNVSLDTTLVAGLRPFLAFDSSANPPQTYPVLPHSLASWQFEVNRPFWGGVYRGVVTASYNNNPQSGIGDTSSTRKTITKKSSLVVVTPQPVAAFIELIALAGIIVLIAKLVMGRQHRKHVKTKWHTYHVKEGETIDEIAKAQGISWRKLAKANNLKPPYNLQKGKTLRIPPGGHTNGD